MKYIKPLTNKMQLSSTTLEEVQSSSIGITIGSFDGVHKGHQHVLSDFVEKCHKRGIRPVVISFSPHPLIVIRNIENFLIDSSHKKRQYLKEKFNIDLVEVEFNQNIREMSGEIFFSELSKQLKKIKLFYAGHDFSLGKGKCFTIKEAREKLSAIEVVEGEAFEQEKFSFSSTSVRDCLKNGEIEKANFILGHPFKLTATVKSGNKIGRTIGFPTANLSFCETQILPQDGVYFVKASLKEKSYRAIVNIGVRPTVTKDNIRVVEVNIFDFNEEIYGEELDVEFYKKIRDERKFSSIDQLRAQITKDKLYCGTLSFYGRFGLIGKNISHSKSSEVYKKLTHNHYLDYHHYDLEEEGQIDMKSFLKMTPFISVTSPYKKAVFERCDKFEGDDTLKAVNCVKLEDDKVIGTNTDFYGIKEYLEALKAERFSRLYILGSGAMADIIGLVLRDRNIAFETLSRKNGNIDTVNLIKDKNTLIINATARSYQPPFPLSCSGTFWDLNYDQPYAEEALKSKTLKYIDGHDLLMRQAKYALSFWNLKTP